MFSSIKRKSIISNVILLLFLSFISTTVYLSYLFQTPKNNSNNISPNLKLFKSSEISNIKGLILKNKNGEFYFEKQQSNEMTSWHMMTPRNIAASSVFFESVFSFFTTTNIKKIYINDKINNSNFSFESPTASMTLILNNNTKVDLHFGLLNTIDNSIYLKVSNRSGIFHVDAPNLSIENISLMELIESKIFNLNLNNLQNFKFSKKKNSNDSIIISKKDDSWVTNNSVNLSPIKFNQFISNLSTIKSNSIVDKQSDSQKKLINILKNSSEYSIEFTDLNKNIITYNISSIIKDFPGVDLKGGNYFMITISNSEIVHLVKADYFSLFDLKLEDLLDVSKK